MKTRIFFLFLFFQIAFIQKGQSVPTDLITSVNTLPSGQISSSGTILCPSSSILLVATAYNTTSYQWQLNGVPISGATASTYNATTAGNYTCVFSNLSGSFTTSAIAITAGSMPPGYIASSGSIACIPNTIQITASGGTGLTYQWRLNGNPIAGAVSQVYFATQTGTYTCAVTNNCGTVISISVSLTFTSPPQASISSSSNSLCNSIGTVLTEVPWPASMYQWQLNGNAISGATSGTYTPTVGGSYTCSVYNQCGSSVSQPIVVSSSSILAAPGSITGNQKICRNVLNTYSIAAVSGATSYNWTVSSGLTIRSGQGTTSISVIASSTFTSGTISVSSSNACATSAATTKSIAYKSCRSALSNSLAETSADLYTVYPNPSAGEFTIAFQEAPSENTVIRLYDMIGNLISNFTNEKEIRFGAELAEGIYLLTITDGEETQLERLVKTR